VIYENNIDIMLNANIKPMHAGVHKGRKYRVKYLRKACAFKNAENFMKKMLTSDFKHDIMRNL
jgi:hypothetical protein